MTIRFLLISVLLMFSSASIAAEQSFRDVADDYLGFVERNAGIITPQQLHQVDMDKVYLLNVNSENQFKQGLRLPNSHHMDWREVLERSEEIPRDKTVVVYCNTMLYSSRAQLLLNMDGFENILLLQGGLNNWNSYVSNLQE